ncbi:hypothetical protein Prum_065000 [Phytohabitans rumicis]|uniref:Uncharacterized protein n=1 Tax=Phytohabitans rumicis TaxID=1076125 RepID=A0A6V8LCZ4_9ACTN|nr:hypothetical protein Prum_065000 [Phytohabitans rumicis]
MPRSRTGEAGHQHESGQRQQDSRGRAGQREEAPAAARTVDEDRIGVHGLA